jgi:hypothetical protein
LVLEELEADEERHTVGLDELFDEGAGVAVLVIALIELQQMQDKSDH